MAVKLTIEVDPDLRRRAKAAAALKGCTLADVVRSALEDFVEQAAPSEPRPLIETDPVLQLAGKFSGSDENVSETADEIMRANVDPVRGLTSKRGRSR